MQPGMLVVDDDADLRETLRQLLEESGYQVNEAGDGVVALHILRETRRPHVVLLDQCLPGITGDALLQMVANDAALCSRHAYVLLTGKPRVEAHQLAQSVPEVDVTLLSKPFDLDDLLATIEQITARLTSVTSYPSQERGQPLI